MTAGKIVMVHWTKLAIAAAAALILSPIACSDFLSGPGVSTNPNVPTTATPEQLFSGVQVAVMAQWENFGDLETWAGQLVGLTRGAEDITDYAIGGDGGLFGQAYGPGGLRDLRAAEAGAVAETPANYKLRGQARVLEALYFGTLADIFGSVAYSDALTPQPKYDSQAVVYAHVQAVLDSAIADLSAGGTGTYGTDFFYGNSFASWTAAAHSLKARLYMHTARTSATVYDPAVLAKVVREASLGISSAAGDLQVNHGVTGSPADYNHNWGLLRLGDFQPAEVHIALIKAAGEDTLLAIDYVPDQYGQYSGTFPDVSRPSDSVSTFAVGQYAPTGIVTYTETRMLLAEALYRLGQVPAAQDDLNLYRASVQAPSLGALTGTTLLGAILREKYIHLFLNMEVWIDYQRTCFPNLALPPNAVIPYMPPRLAPGEDSTTNPNAPVQAPGSYGNPNNPKNDFAIDGAVCFAQVARSR